jgi:single-strand DNA-binding protein
MPSFEKWILVGNLGSDPDMRFTGKGTPVTNISLAVNRRWKNEAGQQMEHTTWYRCTGWGRRAEVMKDYLKKGDLVMIEGQPVTDERGNPKIWFNNNNQPCASYEVNIRDIQFLSTRGENGSGQSRSAQGSPSVQQDYGYPDTDDEIPF